MLKRTVVLALLTLVAAAPAVAEDFRWHGFVARGNAIEIKGINGDVRAEAAPGTEVEVVAEKRARRSDPESVKIEVVEHGGGVTICSVYPSRDSSKPNECRPGSDGRMNVQDNDVTVTFTVRVPTGVAFTGHSVNGQVSASRLDAPVTLNTVNGSVDFSTTSTARASTVNGSIRGSFGRGDWMDALEFHTVNGSITLSLPDGLNTDVKASTVNGDISTEFPLTVTGRFSRRHLDGTIGAGGRTLSLETVNGGITLKKS
jgi:putative adhesin